MVKLINAYTRVVFNVTFEIFLLFQVTDKNNVQFLNSWHELNKPHVLLFDQVPVVPLLYKVGSCSVFYVKCSSDVTKTNCITNANTHLSLFLYS